MNKKSSYKNHNLYKDLSSEEVLEIFFRKYYAHLCRNVFRLVPDKTLAEDLVQEVFLKVWERKDHITFDEKFVFYLKRSCYHAALSFLSGKSYKQDTDKPVMITTAAADNDLLHAELQDEVRRAIGKLPEKTRLIFSLSRFEEMTYKEISLELKISVKAVEKHMGIALKRLKESLKAHLTILLTALFYNFFH